MPIYLIAEQRVIFIVLLFVFAIYQFICLYLRNKIERYGKGGSEAEHLQGAV